MKLLFNIQCHHLQYWVLWKDFIVDLCHYQADVTEDDNVPNIHWISSLRNHLSSKSKSHQTHDALRCKHNLYKSYLHVVQMISMADGPGIGQPLWTHKKWKLSVFNRLWYDILAPNSAAWNLQRVSTLAAGLLQVTKPSWQQQSKQEARK